MQNDFAQAYSQSPILPPQASTGILGRVGYYGGTLFPRLARNVASGITNLFGGNNEVEGDDPSIGAIDPATDTTGKIVDFAGNLAPVALEIALTGKAVNPITKWAGISKLPVLNNVVKDAAAFGAVGLSEDRLTGGEQALEGAGYGALTYLPRPLRLLPAAALALGSKAFFDRNGAQPVVGDFSRGDIASAAGFLTSFLPGKVPWRSPAAPLVDHFVPPPASNYSPQFGPELPTANPATPLQTRTFYENRLRTRMGFDPAATGNPELFATIANPQAGLSAGESANAFMYQQPSRVPGDLGPFIESGLPRPANFTPAELQDTMDAMIEGAMPMRAPDVSIPGGRPLPEGVPPLVGKAPVEQPMSYMERTGQPLDNRAKGKVGLPQGLRPNTGGAASPELMFALARAGIGASLGAAAGGPDNRLGGGLIGAAAGLTPELLRFGLSAMEGKVKPMAEQNNVGAINGGGKLPPMKGNVVEMPDQKLGNFAKTFQERVASKAEEMKAKAAEYNYPFKVGDTIYTTEKGTPYTVEGMAPPQGRNPYPRVYVKDPFTGETSSRYTHAEDGRPFWSDGEGNLLPVQKKSAGIQGPVSNFATVAKPVPGDIIEGARYDAPIEGFDAHQFTLKRPDGSDGTTFVVKGELTKEKIADKVKQVRERFGTQGGFVMPELNAALSRGVVGALVGGAVGGATQKPGENGGFLTGALIGASAAAFGPELGRAFIGRLANSRTSSPSGPGVQRGWLSLIKNFSQRVEEGSGAAMSSSAKASDRIIRWFDQQLGLTMPEAVKNALLGSKGLASAMLDTLDSALTKVSLRFKPHQDLVNMSNKFLDDSVGYTAQQYKADVAQKFAGEEQALKYADFITTARDTVNGLQRMVSDGIGDPTKAAVINGSIGKYLTRSYKLFTSQNWRPEESSIQGLIQELGKLPQNAGASAADLRTSLEQYIREVKQMKGMYKNADFGGSMGQQVSQAVLKERKDLSQAWRDFLGEITDPTERIYQTVFRLRPMAEASKYFSSLVKDVREDGWLPHYFSTYAEMDSFRNTLLQQLQNGPSPEVRAAAQAKLSKFDLKWEGQQNVENHPKFGEVSGGVVTRNVWDTLRTYDNMTDTSGPLLRSIVGLHTAIKLGRTALNPITMVRNFLTMPIFAMIGRTGISDMTEAWRIMGDSAHPLRKEIMEQGIGNVDQVKTEFYKEFENLTGGKYNFGNVDMSSLGLGKFDLDMFEKYARRGGRNILDVYRLPDNMVRIGTYLSAKRRFAEELGLQLNDPKVLEKATNFTNRYTMNYDAVSPAVKTMRQLPFFNLFITYTAEMTRILKNLVVDVAKGSDGTSHSRLYAALPLAMLAAVPDLIQSSSENSLSPQDKADWEKAKSLMPDYARTRYKGGIYRDPKTKQFHYTDFTPLIASDSLNQLIRAAATGDTAAALNVNPLVGFENTPVLNIAASQMAGADIRTMRPFRGQGLDKANIADRFATVAKEVLPPWFPGVGSEAQKFQQAYATNQAGGQGITNTRTGIGISPSDFWQPYWSGVRSGSVNLGVQEQQLVSKAKQEIANEMSYLNQVLKSDAADVTKQAAIEKFKIVAQEIQGMLRQRLEKP